MDQTHEQHPDPATVNDGNAVRRVAADAGYVAIGLGVIGFQQARRLADSLAERASACNLGRVELPSIDRDELGKASDRVRERVAEVRTRVETSARRQANAAGGVVDDVRDRVEPVLTEVRGRIEPVMAQASDRLTSLPGDVAAISLPQPFDGVPARAGRLIEPVVERVEPVMQRARTALAGSAA